MVRYNFAMEIEWLRLTDFVMRTDNEVRVNRPELVRAEILSRFRANTL